MNAATASRLRTRHKEAKLTYIKLNIQTPCPPRGAVPVNTRQDMGSFFVLFLPVRLRSWMRLSDYVDFMVSAFRSSSGFLAGNVTTTNYNYTLSYAGVTNKPTVTVIRRQPMA
jgi:hypothetical protein